MTVVTSEPCAAPQRAVALPPPPDGCTDWPWTDDDARDATGNSPPSARAPWPRITLLTPSFNQGATLEQTIRSVLLQHYPNLEYIIIDGGSTDQSPAIIQRYAPLLTYWRIAPDNGQADAINRGLARATGDIVNWLCSDDMLEPGALHTVARAFLDQPDADVVVGDCQRIDADGRPRSRFRADISSVDLLPVKHLIPQPSCFVRRAMLDRGPGRPPLDPTQQFTMDRELWCYLRSCNARWAHVPQTLSRFRVTPHTKSSRGGWAIFDERQRILRTYAPHLTSMVRWYGNLRVPLQRYARAAGNRPAAAVARWLDAAVAQIMSLRYGRASVRSLDWFEQLKLDAHDRRT